MQAQTNGGTPTWQNQKAHTTALRPQRSLRTGKPDTKSGHHVSPSQPTLSNANQPTRARADQWLPGKGGFQSPESERQGRRAGPARGGVTIRQGCAGVRICEHITLHSEHERRVVGQLRPTQPPEHLLACAASQPASVAAGPRGRSPGRAPADTCHAPSQTGITRGRAPVLTPFSAGARAAQTD